MSATIGEILERLGLMDDEEPMQKEASRSIEEDLSAMIDEVFGLTKVANPGNKNPGGRAANRSSTIRIERLAQQDIENIGKPNNHGTSAATATEKQGHSEEKRIQAGCGLKKLRANSWNNNEKSPPLKLLAGAVTRKLCRLAATIVSVGQLLGITTPPTGGIFSPDRR